MPKKLLFGAGHGSERHSETPLPDDNLAAKEQSDPQTGKKLWLTHPSSPTGFPFLTLPLAAACPSEITICPGFPVELEHLPEASISRALLSLSWQHDAGKGL